MHVSPQPANALQFIVIPHPEELRGGGLLKFGALLARGYRLPPYTTWDDRVRLETYMCNRFLIDFSNIAVQVGVISQCCVCFPLRLDSKGMMLISQLAMKRSHNIFLQNNTLRFATHCDRGRTSTATCIYTLGYVYRSK